MVRSKDALDAIAQDLDGLLGNTATMQALYEVKAEDGDKDAKEQLAVWSTFEEVRLVLLKLNGIVMRLTQVTQLDRIEEDMGE